MSLGYSGSWFLFSVFICGLAFDKGEHQCTFIGIHVSVKMVLGCDKHYVTNQKNVHFPQLVLCHDLHRFSIFYLESMSDSKINLLLC